MTDKNLSELISSSYNGVNLIDDTANTTTNTWSGVKISNELNSIVIPATDLSLLANGSAIELESSTGNNVTILSANSSVAGLLSAETQTIAGNKTFTGTITYSGTIDSDLIPELDITYDLGTANNRWRDLYLSGNTINLGDAQIKADEATGTIALIPPVTVDNPHPKAMVLNARGRMQMLDTTAGAILPQEMTEVANTTDNIFESVTVTGHVNANTFNGDGSQITNVDAVTLQGNTVADLRQYADNAAANVSVDLTGYATETYVDTAVSGIVNAAPTTLDTLNELAAALGDDPNFATTVTNLIGTKLDTTTWTNSTASGIDGTDVSNWNTAYGWGNHASAGYLTSFTESDPTVPAHVKSITSTNVSNWNTAYGWGNHASAGYQAAASAITTSNIGSQSVSEAGRLSRDDNRTIAPSEYAAGKLNFGFTSWGNNNTSPYADFLHLRSYTDGSGGSDNLVMFKKSGIGMRIWQQSYGSGTAYSSYVDVLDSSNYNSYAPTKTGGGASGTWGINITGNAGSATAAQNATFLTQANATWGGRVQLGGNGGGSGVANIAVVQATDGNLHMDSGVGKSVYLNYYHNGAIYFNGGTYSISSNGSQYNGNAASVTNGVYTTGNQSIGGVKTFTGTGPYTNDWFRNNTSGHGLYNQSTGRHFYSPGSTYWHIDGASSTGGLIFYDRYNGSEGNATGRRGYVYYDSNGFGLLHNGGSWWLNTPDNDAFLIIGGYKGLNPYNSVTGRKLMFGGGDENAQASYYIGTNLENYGGNYNKLDIRWHTGIRMGARANYGGIRFYDAEDLVTQIFAIGKDGSYAQANQSMRAPIFYDLDNTAYYSDPGSKGYFHRLGLHNYAGSVSTGNQTSLEIMNNGGTGDGNVAAMSFHCSGHYGMHMHLRSDSYFGIGGWSASTWRWYVQMSTGNMTAAGNVTAYSDPRLKENVKQLKGSLQKICSVNGVEFNWKNLPDIVGNPGSKDYGVLANEIELIAPHAVYESAHTAKDGSKYKTVAYDKLVPLLIEGIKEQQSTITSLEERINKLENLLEKLT